jgi:hypothetical protein
MKNILPPPTPLRAPRVPEGAMKLSALKVAVFEDANPTTLRDRINNFTAGQAVTGHAADFVKEQTFVGLHFAWDGTKYTALIAYTE